MTRKFHSFVIAFFLVFTTIFVSTTHPATAQAKSAFSLIALSDYQKTMAIGQEFYLFAISSNGKTPTFKSSKSAVASVNKYGLVTAKKSGTCKITASIKDAEASCKITVKKTTVTISKTSASIENGKTLRLTIKASTDGEVRWKSSKKSIATVSSTGVVTAKKPGKCEISATVDGTTAVCRLTVKSPSVSLPQKKISLYRGQTFTLSPAVSSNRKPTFKSSSKKIATIDANGVITAVRHGTATITVTVDDVSAQCTVNVESPVITLSNSTLELAAGSSHTLSATTSSGNPVEWSSSNINVATIDANGVITARQKGKAYIYAKEDGAKASCIVKVTP